MVFSFMVESHRYNKCVWNQSVSPAPKATSLSWMMMDLSIFRTFVSDGSILHSPKCASFWRKWLLKHRTYSPWSLCQLIQHQQNPMQVSGTIHHFPFGHIRASTAQHQIFLFLSASELAISTHVSHPNVFLAQCFFSPIVHPGLQGMYHSPAIRGTW